MPLKLLLLVSETLTVNLHVSIALKCSDSEVSVGLYGSWSETHETPWLFAWIYMIWHNRIYNITILYTVILLSTDTAKTSCNLLCVNVSGGQRSAQPKRSAKVPEPKRDWSEHKPERPSSSPMYGRTWICFKGDLKVTYSERDIDPMMKLIRLIQIKYVFLQKDIVLQTRVPQVR